MQLWWEVFGVFFFWGGVWGDIPSDDAQDLLMALLSGPLLVVLREPEGMPEMNLGWLCTRQVPSLLCYCSCPR